MSNEENKIINNDSTYDPMQDKKHDDESHSNSQNHTEEQLGDMPQVDSEQKSKSVNKLFVAIGVFVGLILLFGCAVLFANNYKERKAIEKAEAQKVAERKESASTDAGNNIAEEKARAKIEADMLAGANMASASEPTTTEPITVNDTSANAVPTAQPNYVTNTAPQNNNIQVAPPRNYTAQTAPIIDTSKERKLEGDVMAYSGSKSSASVSGGGMDEESAPAQAGGSGGARNSFASQYTSTAFTASVAGQRKNLTMLLKQGTIIPCVLLTKIDSTYAGQTACQVAKDVYSANGKTLLIERGSKVIGEQRVQITQGQARVFVLWAQLETPKGVQVQLDSGSTDSLGASGISARVNNHYLKRFGGAILISMVEDAIGLLKDNGGQSGGVTYNSTSDSANEIAVEALKNTINIPPTAQVHQGSLLNVFVSRDVDFQKVYNLVNRH